MKLKKILKDTRKWAEQLAEEFPLDYHENLTGLCAIVSKELFTRLIANGYKCEIAYNDRHCFVLHNKNRVIDLTASQFGLADISIFTLSGKTRRYWKIVKTFTNIKDLASHQKKRGWNDEQI